MDDDLKQDSGGPVEPLDAKPFSMEAAARAKLEWRRQRAKLPFEEKVRIVVELQKRRAPIMAARGVETRVWDLPELADSPPQAGDASDERSQSATNPRPEKRAEE